MSFTNVNVSVDILIVDDEKDICDLVSGVLADEGYSTRTSLTGYGALEALYERQPGCVLLDVWLGDGSRDGLKILETIKRNHPYVSVVMMSGHSTVETAVAAIKMGAYDFIEKPFQTERLLLVVKRAIEAAKLKRENDELKVCAPFLCSLMGSSSAILEAKQTLTALAPSQSHICLYGPVGCDRIAIARSVHNLSLRTEQPFLVLNCASLPPQQIEAELFGLEIINTNEKAAQKIGLLEQAHHGTLYIDEVSLLPPSAQARLSSFFQNATFQRLGGNQPIRVDVRVLSGTSQTEETLLKGKALASDLFYRLNVASVKIPPLAERTRDLALLSKSFLSALAAAQNTPQKNLMPEALAILESYSWPGDIQQFKNVLEWMLITSISTKADCLGIPELPPEILQGNNFLKSWDKQSLAFASLPIKEAREAFEREYLQEHLKRFEGHISQTAKFIGMDRAALHRKLKMLGIHSSDTPDAAENEEDDCEESSVRKDSSGLKEWAS
ncbi:sigma-54-dependent Fis family transcriptional regulator [Alphaproteobacteria bacterium]|nr:sigma-54-dependent Fis family transcriptional regulator [Alphaproteobacteria bacterium]GHS98178.1 sigma-54-dependent Fis family transcriptional regulator [Alphaproteobacteria bacterium]